MNIEDVRKYQYLIKDASASHVADRQMRFFSVWRRNVVVSNNVFFVRGLVAFVIMIQVGWGITNNLLKIRNLFRGDYGLKSEGSFFRILLGRDPCMIPFQVRSGRQSEC